MKKGIAIWGALALMVCAVVATPVTAVPVEEPGAAETWCQYLEQMCDKAPMALHRGYFIINQLEQQGEDVEDLKAIYTHAKTNLGYALNALGDGKYTINENPYIFYCKADCLHLTGAIAEKVGGNHPYTKGMLHAVKYCFPGYADFVAGL